MTNAVKVNNSSVKMGHVQVSIALSDSCSSLEDFLQTGLEEIHVLIIIIIIPMRRIGSWVNHKLNSQIDGVRCRLLDALHFYVPIYVMSLIHVCSLL